MALDSLLKNADPIVAGALDRALSDKDVSVDEAIALFDSTGLEMNLLVAVADELRRKAVGDTVTYVVNRNINFTNVCIKQCGFCAFSRDFREEEGYFLPNEEIVRRAKEAASLGATEVCIQAGLPPKTCTSTSATRSRKNSPTFTFTPFRLKRCSMAPSGQSPRLEIT
jgi:FO synthase subunit 2